MEGVRNHLCPLRINHPGLRLPDTSSASWTEFPALAIPLEHEEPGLCAGGADLDITPKVLEKALLVFRCGFLMLLAPMGNPLLFRCMVRAARRASGIKPTAAAMPTGPGE